MVRSSQNCGVLEAGDLLRDGGDLPIIQMHNTPNTHCSTREAEEVPKKS